MRLRRVSTAMREHPPTSPSTFAPPWSRRIAAARRDLCTVGEYADAAAWDDFVERHPEGRFCHLFAYPTVAEIYGYRPRRYAFCRGDRIVGILPAVEARSRLFGPKLVSQPFSEYGGLLLDPEIDDATIHWIVGELRRELRALHLPALELHGCQGLPRLDPRLFFVAANPQQQACLALDDSLDHLWAKTIDHSVRKAVNKARRNGLTCREESGPAILASHFYPLYLDSMQRLGAPPHCIDYFLRCRELLGDRMKIFWALRDDQPIAGLLGFTCGKRINIVNIVSDHSQWHLRPNDLVHWEFIRWAAESGFRVFDFGPVRYEGQGRYKSKWGCATRDHGHYFLFADATASRVSTFDSSSKTMHLLSQIWSHWMPRRWAIAFGPMLRRQLVR